MHRQAAGSGIPAIAQRDPPWAGAPVRLLRRPCARSGFDRGGKPRTSAGRSIDVMQSLAVCGEVQVLGVTKRGDAGTETINSAIHKLVAADHPVPSRMGLRRNGARDPPGERL